MKPPKNVDGHGSWYSDKYAAGHDQIMLKLYIEQKRNEGVRSGQTSMNDTHNEASGSSNRGQAIKAK